MRADRNKDFHCYILLLQTNSHAKQPHLGQSGIQQLVTSPTQVHNIISDSLYKKLANELFDTEEGRAVNEGTQLFKSSAKPC